MRHLLTLEDWTPAQIAEAIATARRALEEFVIRPTKTTIPLCREVLGHERFHRGQWDTTLVEREML